MNCQYCETHRYINPGLFTPNQEIGIVLVGVALSEVFLNEEIRKMMDYCHIATENHETGVYKDTFDGPFIAIFT